MNCLRVFAAGLLVLLVGAGQVAAQVNGFDARQPCGPMIRGASDVDKLMIAAWVYGYLAAVNTDVRPVDLDNNKTMLGNIIQVCAKDETRSLLSIVAASKPQGQEGPGSSAEAKARLLQFLDPAADRVALTAALKPTEADIRAVYGAPLADQLVAMYAAMFTPGAAIGPKPGQDEVILIRTTTASLKDGDAVLREFPGGYEKVRGYFVGDVPIVRFKFVEQGQTTGLAFDGLIYVKDRWVLMPKPWRALD